MTEMKRKFARAFCNQETRQFKQGVCPEFDREGVKGVMSHDWAVGLFPNTEGARSLLKKNYKSEEGGYIYHYPEAVKVSKKEINKYMEMRIGRKKIQTKHKTAQFPAQPDYMGVNPKYLRKGLRLMGKESMIEVDKGTGAVFISEKRKGTLVIMPQDFSRV